MTDAHAAPLGWQWANREYKEHTGDAEWLMREACRRAIDIRDQGVTNRAVVLVDVLHQLQEALGFEPVDIVTFWSGR